MTVRCSKVDPAPMGAGTKVGKPTSHSVETEVIPVQKTLLGVFKLLKRRHQYVRSSHRRSRVREGPFSPISPSPTFCGRVWIGDSPAGVTAHGRNVAQPGGAHGRQRSDRCSFKWC